MAPDILVYQDYVHNNAPLFESLCGAFGIDRVAWVNTADILNGLLDSSVRLFVMPGGADLYYAEKLDGAGNEAIRAYVENGGNYLGICAGAYYACRALEWAKNEGPAAIIGPRELAFFAGIAQGPVYEFIEQSDFRKSWTSAPLLRFGNGESEQRECRVCYQGGPVFIPDKDAHFETLAVYAELPGHPPAIVETSVGAGRAILCSPHLEMNASALDKTLYRNDNMSYAWETAVVEKLRADESPARKFWLSLLDRAATRNKRLIKHAS